MYTVNIISIIFTFLSALEHLYILYLETFITQSNKTSKVFNISEEKLKDKNISTLLKNQGVYNGLIAILLFISIFKNDIFWMRLLLGYIILVAIYGGISSDLKIIFKQGGLAIIALIFSLFWEN